MPKKIRMSKNKYLQMQKTVLGIEQYDKRAVIIIVKVYYHILHHVLDTFKSNS